MIRVKLDGVSRQVSAAEFLSLIPRWISNMCIVARSLHKSYKLGAFDECAELRRHFLTAIEFQLLAEAILNDELRQYVQIVGIKVELIKMWDHRISSLLVSVLKLPLGKEKEAGQAG